MLKAFRKQLKVMSLDPKDQFTAYVRQQVGPREAVLYAAPLRQMVMSLPEMIQQIQHWTEEADAKNPLLKLHAFALAYMYNPTDFLPEKTQGLFGYVDDAYLATSVYERTMHEVDWAGMKPYLDHPILADAVPGWAETTRRVLPEITRRIDHLLNRLVEVRTGRPRTRELARML